MTKMSDIVVSSYEGPEVATASEEPKQESTKKSASEAVKASDETANESETLGGIEEAVAEGEELDDESSDTESDDKGKNKNGFKKRVDKLTKARAEAERRAIAAEERLKIFEEQARKPGQSQELSKAKSAASTGSAPNPNDYETNADYQAALVEFKVEEKLTMREAKAKAEAAQAELKKQEQTFIEKLVEFKESHDDWDEAMDSVEHIPLSDFFKKQIATSDLGPELAYQLAKHPGDYERLAKLPPEQLLRQLGKFEARFADAEEKPSVTETKKTKAPPPISPVSAKGSKAAKKSLDEMDYDEFRKERKEQLRAQR